jgi:DNA transformation protein and related proteins
MDAASLQKLFEPFAAVAIKGMFGGRGVSVGGLMFALQAGDRIYLKTDAATAPHFKEAGSEPFVFRSPMGPKETSYWLMPKAAEADPKTLTTWCELALGAARRAAAAKAEKAGGKNAKIKAAPAKASPAKKTARKAAVRPSRPGKSRMK